MFMKWFQQNDQWRFYATSESNEIIELDAQSENQILDWSANEILELDCASNKTSIGFTKQVLVSKSKVNETVSCKGTD